MSERGIEEQIADAKSKLAKVGVTRAELRQCGCDDRGPGYACQAKGLWHRLVAPDEASSPDHGAAVAEAAVRRQVETTFSGPGVKHDQGKPRMDQWKLLPTFATEAIVRVLVFGVKKYSAWGWQKVVGWRWRYTAALLRHVFAYARGQARDPETGEHHLAHAGCCLLFLLDNELRLEAGHKDVPDGDAEEVAR